jgi:hypothetical protein
MKLRYVQQSHGRTLWSLVAVSLQRILMMVPRPTLIL